MFLLAAIGFSFSKEKWKIRSFFFSLALIVNVIMLNSLRAFTQTSAILESMVTSGFILGVIAVSFMMIYLLIFYTIELITKMKNKREMKWSVSTNPN
jgi:hypothetical protein